MQPTTGTTNGAHNSIDPRFSDILSKFQQGRDSTQPLDTSPVVQQRSEVSRIQFKGDEEPLNPNITMDEATPPSTKFRIPTYSPYTISQENASILNTVDKMRSNGLRPNILVQGKQGTGKTELVEQYAASRKLPLATLDIGRLSESSQILGRMEFHEGVGTVYIPGLFIEALQTPNCVIHLQELNRPESDVALNAIFSVLDDTQRRIWIDELQRYVEVAEGVVIFATLNEGFEFIGTMPLDLALRNRFHCKIELGMMPEDMEVNLIIRKSGITQQQAAPIVKLANQLRNNTQDPLWVSYRDTINIGLLLKHGLPLLTAAKTTIGLNQEQAQKLSAQAHFSGQLYAPLSGYTVL